LVALAEEASAPKEDDTAESEEASAPKEDDTTESEEAQDSPEETEDHKGGSIDTAGE
jgi:hypothetical protein